MVQLSRYPYRAAINVYTYPKRLSTRRLAFNSSLNTNVVAARTSLRAIRICAVRASLCSNARNLGSNVAESANACFSNKASTASALRTAFLYEASFTCENEQAIPLSVPVDNEQSHSNHKQ